MTSSQEMFAARQGMAVYGPQALEIFRALDARILRWADDCGAVEMRFPPLIRIDELELFDYFTNFPHIALCACGIGTEHHHGLSAKKVPLPRVETAMLDAADYALLPAACYNIYLHYRDRALTEPTFVTTVAQCFRNESHYRGFERLRGFTMREIVCLGSSEAVKQHLQVHKRRILDLAAELGLPVDVETASDPFFDRQSERAMAAQLFPTKEEIRYRGELAIASVNFHRNFFGERCNISNGDQPVFTGCVAFGMERWIHALTDHYRGDVDAVVAALSERVAA